MPSCSIACCRQPSDGHLRWGGQGRPQTGCLRYRKGRKGDRSAEFAVAGPLQGRRIGRGSYGAAAWSRSVSTGCVEQRGRESASVLAGGRRGAGIACEGADRSTDRTRPAPPADGAVAMGSDHHYGVEIERLALALREPIEELRRQLNSQSAAAQATQRLVREIITLMRPHFCPICRNWLEPAVWRTNGRVRVTCPLGHLIRQAEISDGGYLRFPAVRCRHCGLPLEYREGTGWRHEAGGIFAGRCTLCGRMYADGTDLCPCGGPVRDDHAALPADPEYDGWM